MRLVKTRLIKVIKKEIKRYEMKRILCYMLVMFFFTSLYSQKEGVLESYADTNKIIFIQYPPLTEREGKGLKIPVPPAEHPRLFLTKKDIPLLIEKANNILLKRCWEKITSAASLNTNGYLKLDSNKANNNDINIRNAIEAKALLFLFSNDLVQGRQAVDNVLHYYATLKIDMLKDDVCREIGRAIITGAIVYDWCYSLTSASEKLILIGRMETLATYLEIEWPKLRQSSITGHGAEAQLARDMLSCGVATYNEKPEIYQLAAGRIMAEFVPSRKFFFPAGYHHQGSSYGPYRFYWDVIATFIFDKMGYPKIFGNDQQKVPYYFIYSRRPDGQMIRNGDDFTELFTTFGKYWVNGGTMNALAGSYFKDPILINEALKEDNLGKGGDYLFDFLFYDTNIASNISSASLPNTRYFKEPFGAMIARTGWEDGLKSPSVVAEMKVGVYNFVNHQHLDAGSFQLYYKGPLTVQSGVYQGKNGGYGSDHFKNYYQRSIAHNTMLIYDPKEKFISGNKEVINDGGQRLPNNNRETTNLSDFLMNDYKTGEVLSHAFGPDSVSPDFSYLKGNIAAAYSSKVKNFTRSFVFLNFKNSKIPAALIVFDNITSANKEFKKFWLLHSVEEPIVNNNTTVIKRTGKGYSGKMINTTLLPSNNNFTISKIGGSEEQYSVFGKNFPQWPNSNNNSTDSAKWRIELSPKISAANDLFLNVMEVMDDKIIPSINFLPKKIETEKFAGVIIDDRIVLFSKSNDIINGKFTLNIAGNKEMKVLITDIEEGNWEIRSVKDHSKFQKVKNTNKLLYFTIKTGSYVISKK